MLTHSTDPHWLSLTKKTKRGHYCGVSGPIIRVGALAALLLEQVDVLTGSCRWGNPVELIYLVEKVKIERMARRV
jgi:hypothetical protein